MAPAPRSKPSSRTYTVSMMATSQNQAIPMLPPASQSAAMITAVSVSKLAPGSGPSSVEEDWITPVDTRMETIGGTVFRRALSDVEDTVDDEDIAAIKADLAQMKAEHAQARTDRKAKIQDKINQLDSKLQAQLQKAKDQRQAAERDAQLKLDALKAKAKAAAAKAGA